jgi:thiol:disulfide interchange protein
MPHAVKTLVRWVLEEAAEQATAIARRSGRPLFVHLYAPGCKGCETLDRTTYMDREVAAVLNERFVPVRLNARRDNPALRMLNREPGQVFSPVLVVSAPDGRELRRTAGHLSSQAMLLELHIALAMAKMDGGRWVEAHRILDEAVGRYSLASAGNGLCDVVCRWLIA